MNLLVLHDCAGEVTGDAAHRAAGGGVDYPDAVAFCFCCVCHSGVCLLFFVEREYYRPNF